MIERRIILLFIMPKHIRVKFLKNWTIIFCRNIYMNKMRKRVKELKINLGKTYNTSETFSIKFYWKCPNFTAHRLNHNGLKKCKI